MPGLFTEVPPSQPLEFSRTSIIVSESKVQVEFPDFMKKNASDLPNYFEASVLVDEELFMKSLTKSKFLLAKYYFSKPITKSEIFTTKFFFPIFMNSSKLFDYLIRLQRSNRTISIKWKTTNMQIWIRCMKKTIAR